MYAVGDSKNFDKISNVFPSTGERLTINYYVEIITDSNTILHLAFMSSVL